MKHLTLSYDKVQKEFPKAVEDIIKWLSSKEELKEAIVSEAEGKISDDELMMAVGQIAPMIIQFDPRKLYEYFDENNVKIFISSHPDSNDVFIHHNSVVGHSYPANSRIEAEEQAFLEAFSVVEKRLVNEEPITSKS